MSPYVSPPSLPLSPKRYTADIVLPYVLHFGTEEQKQRYIPAACAGKCITALAMTEPGAGSDLQVRGGPSASQPASLLRADV